MGSTPSKPTTLKLYKPPLAKKSSLFKPKQEQIDETIKVKLASAAVLREREIPFRALVRRLKSLDTSVVLSTMHTVKKEIDEAWMQVGIGRDLAIGLIEILAKEGGLFCLLNFIASEDPDMQIEAAQVLEVSLTVNNRRRLAKQGLDPIVHLAKASDDVRRNYGIAILEHMFKMPEEICSKIIELGGLQAVLDATRSNDVDVQKHCAKALANFAMYGGRKNQKVLIQLNGHQWLFPLAFSKNRTVCFNACIAIVFLAVNREIEDEIKESDTLTLVKQFVTTTDPQEFSLSDQAQVHGRTKDWLRKMCRLLGSTEKHAQAVAAFHFAAEAYIRKIQGTIPELYDIGAVPLLKKVAASTGNDLASNVAAQALELIDEEVPIKLSPEVIEWRVRDVQNWLKIIGFHDYIDEFIANRVDGHYLVLLTKRDLADDMGIKADILCERFLWELSQLKQQADYAGCDPDDIAGFLRKIGPEYTQYTYNLIQAGVTSVSVFPLLTDDMLLQDCEITNGIHRACILHAVKVGPSDHRWSVPVPEIDGAQSTEAGKHTAGSKALDVFISYRRATGSQLASLLKVHLQLRGFSVFIDVEELEAGQFDNLLLNNVRKAKSFLLILTPNSMDRCIGDDNNKDWMHMEMVTALKHKSNIVPVMDRFKWPPIEQLPQDVRDIVIFNGIKWIHDYQDACIDKLERFLQNPQPPMKKHKSHRKRSSKDKSTAEIVVHGEVEELNHIEELPNINEE